MTLEADRPYLKRPGRGVPPPRSGLPQLAVLVIAFKSHQLLEMCLASVAEHLPDLPVYIYENSGDGYPGRDELAARHPEVHWVMGRENLGFAAAVNALVQHTPPDANLLLLNPDARLQGPLSRTRHLLRQPGVAAVAPRVRDDALGPVPWDVATRRMTAVRALISNAGYADLFRGTPLSHLYARQPTESQCVEGYVAGCCLAINRVAWNTVGAFDEEFYLYGEEADWQARARGAGWRILLADELGVEHGNLSIGEDLKGPDAMHMHGGEYSDNERQRNRDLLRASTALVLEHHQSVHHADAFLAGTTVLDRVQRTRRAARKITRRSRRNALPAIVITTNRLVYGGAERQKVLLATELNRRGYPVTIACVQRFGPLVKGIPPGVRVVRQPWWAPVLDMPAGPAVLISGDTNTETGFATLWRAGGKGRRWLVAAHVPAQEDRPIYARPLTAAMRRADGFIVPADRHWDMLAVNHRLRGRRFVAPNGVAAEGEPLARVRAAGEPPHTVAAMTDAYLDAINAVLS